MMDINRSAPIISTHEIVIRASLERVWQLHTRIARWSEWNPDIVRAEPSRPAESGAECRWETAGLVSSSFIGEEISLERVAWSGVSNGVTGVHVWTFTPHADGVLVRTEESWEGDALPREHEDIQRALDDFLVGWLAHLKSLAESRSEI